MLVSGSELQHHRPVQWVSYAGRHPSPWEVSGPAALSGFYNRPWQGFAAPRVILMHHKLCTTGAVQWFSNLLPNGISQGALRSPEVQATPWAN